MEKTVFWNFRNVPEDLAREVKSAAALAGVSMKAWVLQACQDKLKTR